MALDCKQQGDTHRKIADLCEGVAEGASGADLDSKTSDLCGCAVGDKVRADLYSKIADLNESVVGGKVVQAKELRSEGGHETPMSAKGCSRQNGCREQHGQGGKCIEADSES